MKLEKALVGVALAAAMLVASCSTTSQQKIADIIQQVQDKALGLCSYEPTAAYLLQVLAANDPALVGTAAFANALATAICGAVKPAPGPGPTPPKTLAHRAVINVGGTVVVLPPGPISGRFIK